MKIFQIIFFSSLTFYFSKQLHSQTTRIGFSWLGGNYYTTLTSSQIPYGNCGNLTVTVSCPNQFRKATVGTPYNNTGAYFPADNTIPNNSIPITLTFSQPVSNLRIRFIDLDENVGNYGQPEESVSNFSISPSSVTNLNLGVNNIYLTNGNVTPEDNNPNYNNNDASGWANWIGTLSSISFNYNRPAPLYGLIIDSIYVDCPVSCNLQTNLGSDQTLCNGQSTSLNATQVNATSYLWNTGSTASSINVSNPGTYWVTISNSNCNVSDTINIAAINLPSNFLGSDTILCPNTSYLLQSSLTGTYSYLWSTGETTSNISVSQPGLYWLKVSNGNCFAIDSINVQWENLNLLPVLSNYFICGFEEIEIDAASNQVTAYLWNTGSTLSSIVINTPGSYWVDRYVNNCIVRSNVLVQNSENSNLTFTINECSGNSIVIGGIKSDAISYNWNNGKSTPTIVVNSSGNYVLSYLNNCGVSTETYLIDFKNCYCNLFVPNTFTPDEDEFNQEFFIKSDCVFSEFHLEIYNRWGEIVFESFDEIAFWDGYYGYEKAPDGVYTYKVQYRHTFSNDEFKLTGHINLIR